MIRRENRHDVLMLQFTTDEVFGTIELDLPMGIDLANPRDRSSGDWEDQMPTGVAVMFESKFLRRMTEKRPEPISKDSRISGPVLRQGECPARFLEMIVSKESIAAPTDRAKGGMN